MESYAWIHAFVLMVTDVTLVTSLPVRNYSHHLLVGSVDGNAEEVANRSAYLFDARELAAARKGSFPLTRHSGGLGRISSSPARASGHRSAAGGGARNARHVRGRYPDLVR